MVNRVIIVIALICYVGGTINITNSDMLGNMSVKKEFSPVTPNSGVITIGIVAGTGVEALNVIELIEVIE